MEKRKKKGSKKRRKSQHEGDSEGESDDEGEENTAGNLKVEQEKLEAERQSILQNKELLVEV